MSENGGDYFLASRAIRNTIEYLSALQNLPNNLTLPCNLPSPLPAFSSLFPLKFCDTTNRYTQPSDIELKASYSDSYKSTVAESQRKMVSNNVKYFPSLIVDAAPNTAQTTFTFSTLSIQFVTLSDGAKAIRNGLLAAFPQVDFHIDCWSHLELTITKKRIKNVTMHLTYPTL